MLFFPLKAKYEQKYKIDNLLIYKQTKIMCYTILWLCTAIHWRKLQIKDIWRVNWWASHYTFGFVLIFSSNLQQESELE